MSHQQHIIEAVLRTSGVREFESSINGAVSSMDKLQNRGRQLSNVGRSMTLGITAPITGLAGVATKLGMDFQAQMSEVSAISGATANDLELIESKARELGSTTKFTATQAGEAFNYMALAGWDVEQMLGGVEGMLALAAASGEDLGLTADIVTDNLTAFNMEAEESNRLADVMAATNANANTSVSQLGKSFEYAAPVAGALGYTVEDTSLAIGLMSNAGIKADKAGTALRSMMTNLAKPTKEARGVMDELGISITNADGSMKSLDEIMMDLRVAFAGLTEDQQAAASATLFGKEAMSGALAIINSSEESYNKLRDSIVNSKGAAESMAEIMSDNLKGDINELVSALQELALVLFDNLEPSLRDIVQWLTKVVQWFGNLSPTVQKIIIGFGLAAAAAGPLLTALGFMMQGISGLSGVFTLLSNPIGWIILLVGALATGIIYLWNTNEAFRDGVISAWQSIVDFKRRVGEWFYETVMSIVEWYLGMRDSIIQGAKDIYNRASTWIYNFLTDTVNGFLNMRQNILDGLSNFIGGIVQWFGNLGTRFSEGIQGIINNITGFTSSFFQAGSNIMGNLWEGMKSGFSTIRSGFSDFLGGIRSQLPFSPPKDKSSPLVGLHKNGIMTEIARGIYAGEPLVDGAIRDVLKHLQEQAVSGFTINTMFENQRKTALDNIKNNDSLTSTQRRNLSLAINEQINQVQSMMNKFNRNTISNDGQSTQMVINLSMGGQVFRALVDSITEQQDADLNLAQGYI